jgi:hypothetical protein
MKAFTIPTVFIISLATFTSALPTLAAVPEASSSKVLVARQGGGPNEASCYGRHDPNHFALGLTIYTTGPAFATDYGRGLLDNLRGQCGQINNWGYSYYNNNQNGVATFEMSQFIRPHCVEDAIWLSTNPTGAVNGVQCQWDGQ